jgi:hypothetical protein
MVSVEGNVLEEIIGQSHSYRNNPLVVNGHNRYFGLNTSLAETNVSISFLEDCSGNCQYPVIYSKQLRSDRIRPDAISLR